MPGHHPRWTPEDDARMLAMFADGASVDDVALALNRTQSAIACRCASKGTSPGALGSPRRSAGYGPHEMATLPATELARLRAVEGAARAVVQAWDLADDREYVMEQVRGLADIYKRHPTPDPRDARIAALSALLERAEDIIGEYAPGHTVWLDEARAALRGDK